MMRKLRGNRYNGFTLAELLIALAILGVIATFTIPKVLQAQQNAQKVAESKDVIAALSQAYTVYQSKNAVTSLNGGKDYTPYLNYVKVDTASVIDDSPGNGSISCGSGASCLALHQGGIVAYYPNDQLCNTTTTNATYFLYDPDGTYSGSTTGNGKALGFWLYYNGKIRTFASMDVTTYGWSGSCQTSASAGLWGPDPSWFSW